MVTNAPRDLGSYDLFLEYSGRKVGLILAKDEAGNIIYSPALAPNLQPQFRTGSFGYEQTPSEIDIPLAWEDFSLGCGFEDDPNESPAAGPRGYSHSRGIDASERTRLYLSPERQSLSAGIDQAPTKFYFSSSLGFYALAGTSIYYWTGGNFEEKNDASADAVNYVDIIEMDGVLYASRGGSADYKYSTDGATWTAFTDSDNNFSYWATRGSSSADAVLWGIKSDGTMKNTTNGQNSGVAWSAATSAGHTSETTTGFVSISDNLYAFKREGIYAYTDDLWLGGALMNVTTNGKQPYVWGDQKVYVPYGNRLHQFDPVAVTIAPVFPSLAMAGHSEVNGQITAVCGDSRWLYLALKNASGNTYIIKGNPYANDGAGEWHTFIYLGANDCNAMVVAPPSALAPSITNPTLVIGYGTAASYYILPRSGRRPEDDGEINFDTALGTLYTSYTGFGAMGFNKFLNSGRIVGSGLSTTEKIELYYQVDGGVPVSILTATTSGVTSQNILTEVEYLRARAVIEMQTGSNGSTPVGYAAALHATPNPPRKRTWSFLVKVADDLNIRGGSRSRYSGRDLEQFLFGSVTKRCRLYDRRGSSFIVRVLDVKGVGIGGDHDLGVMTHTAEIGQAT